MAFEKVNPSHPDKLADRIAGAIVDQAYRIRNNPKIAVEVMIGHGVCHIIAESSVKIPVYMVRMIVLRIAGTMEVDYVQVPQDAILAENQRGTIRCGDNGIFRGMPVTDEQRFLTNFAKQLYTQYPYDGKFVVDHGILTICQSHVSTMDLLQVFPDANINPLGDWIGGPDVDTGATNRKLGSDMGDSATGGGLAGKDCSKADVSVNIYAWLKAQQTGEPVELSCSIGDSYVDGRPYSEIVAIAKEYIDSIGGFEKFAEWGLIR